MLHRLTGVTLSVTIEDSERKLPKSAMLRFIGECSGVRFAKPHQLAAAASAYTKNDVLFLLIHGKSRPLEKEWLEFLATASAIL